MELRPIRLAFEITMGGKKKANFVRTHCSLDTVFGSLSITRDYLNS